MKLLVGWVATEASVASASASIDASKESGACVWTLDLPVEGLAEICRDDGTRRSCIPDEVHQHATFTAARNCKDVDFPCVSTAWNGANRHVGPGGKCPPGSEFDAAR